MNKESTSSFNEEEKELLIKIEKKLSHNAYKRTENFENHFRFFRYHLFFFYNILEENYEEYTGQKKWYMYSMIKDIFEMLLDEGDSLYEIMDSLTQIL